MSSSGGPRAQGTDGTDFQFRQRVDNHYKLMAEARKSLTFACQIKLAASLVLALRALTCFAFDDDSTAVCCVCGALALLILGGARTGLALAKSQKPGGQLSLYKSVCVLSLLLAVALGVLSAALRDGRPAALFAFEMLCLLPSLFGAVKGVQGAGELHAAFELQAKKRGK